MNILLYASVVLVWGSTWLAIKFQLGDVAPSVSVCWRFALAAIAMALWCRARGLPLKLTRDQHARLALLGGLLFCGNYELIYEAERYLTSGLVALIFSLLPLFNLLLGALLLGRALSLRALVGVGVGVTGVVIAFWPDIAAFDIGKTGSIGLVIALGGTLTASLGNLVAMRNAQRSVPVLPGTAIAMGYGALWCAVLVVLRGDRFTIDLTAPYLLSLAYLAVFGSVIAFGFYLTLLGRIGPERAAYSALLIPIIALVMSHFFEGYDWSTRLSLGLLLTLGGNGITLLKLPVRRRSEPAAVVAACPSGGAA
jgi:drug/metabolite transporter (DMT)-like permease